MINLHEIRSRRREVAVVSQSGFRLLRSPATLLCFLFVMGSVTLGFAQITNLGHAIHLDGTTSGTVTASGFQGFPNTNITVEFWARSTDITKNGSFFSYGASGQPNMFLIYNHQNLTVWVNNLSSVATGVSLTDGLWHHIAVTWSTSGNLEVFKDGALAFSTPNHQAGTVLGDNGTLVLGQDQDLIGGGFDPAQAFLGDLDEVRIWSVIRTPAQISQNLAAPLVGNEPTLAAYYRFSEGFGTNTADSTGRGHNATLLSGAAWLPLAPYNPGTALNFTNGFAVVPHAPALNAFPLTVSAWLRTTSTQALDVLVSKYTDFEPSSGEPNGYQLFLVNGSLSAFYMKNYSERVDFRAFGTNAGPVNDGLWHHVAFTVDGSAGKLYVDGVLRGTRVWQGSAGPVISTNSLSFGYIGANGFLGQLDELSLWNTSLDAAGVQQRMNRRLAGTEANLLAVYHCDDGLGTLLYDATGLGHDGTLQYSASFGSSQARIQGLAQLSGRVTSAGGSFAGAPVSALLAPVSGPPLLPIPDNQTVTSTNLVTLPGSIESMQINVNITHPYSGDLELTLIHPDGTEVRLKNSDGTDAEPDILTGYPNPTLPVQTLAALNGKPIAGAWRLRVTDSFLLDSGVLNTWSLQFGPTPVLTDANGRYVFSNLYSGIYTVQPSQDGIVFNPASRTSAVDRTNLDFSVLSGFVSGRVRDNTIAFPGARISAGPGLSTTTASDGRFRLVNLPPGSQTISVSTPGYAFSPSQISGVALGSTNLNFQVVGYPIAGRITGTNGNGVSGVSVAASTGAGAAISGSDGNYLISAVAPGTAVVTPFKPGVTFSPAFASRNVGPAVSNVNFVAVQSPPTITTLKNQVIAKNGSTGELRFEVNDAETPPARLQVTGNSSNPGLVPVANIVFDGVGIQRTVVVTPATNQFGTATITVAVTDESGLVAESMFVLRVNQLPLPGVGLALNFDGVNDSAVGPLNVVVDKGNYSVETWVFAPSNSGPRTLISQGNRLALGVDASGKIQASTNWNTGVQFPFGAWHHLALVRESDNTRLFLDGALKASLGSALAQPAQNSTFRVGTDGSGAFWLGAIDELRVWRVARTASEIASNLLVRVTGNEPNLGGLWRFDETTGSVASNSLPSVGNLGLLNGPSRIQSPLVFDHYVTLLGRNINDLLPGYDADGDPMTFALVSPPAHGTVTLLSSNTGAFVYTADGLGEDQFTFSVNDGFADSETHPITILVLPDTNAPTISFLADKTIAEDTALGPLPFVVNDSERQAELLPVFGQSSNPTLVPDANITISGTGTNRAFTVRPATNQFGTTTITLVVSDGSQQSTASFLLTVTPVNDAPTISVLTNQVVPRNALNFGQLFTFQDVDTPLESLVLKATSDNAVASTYGNYPNGDAGVSRTTPAGSEAKISITSSSIASGQATVTVTADDGEFITTRSFTVIVNDPPVIAAIANKSTFRNTPTAPIAISISDVDSPVANATLTATSSNPVVVDDSGFAFSGSGGNRSLVITPIPGRIGVTTITVSATDGLSKSSRAFQLFVEEGPVFEHISLPVLAGDDHGTVTAINDSGQVVGTSVDPIGYPQHSVIWQYSEGQATVAAIPGLESEVRTWPKAMNNKGDVFGQRFSFPGTAMYLFRNGTQVTPPATGGSPEAINMNDAGIFLWRSNFSYCVYQSPTFTTNLGSPYIYGGAEPSYPTTLVLDPIGNVTGSDAGGGPLRIWKLVGTNGLQLINAGPLGDIVIGQGVYPVGMNSQGEIAGWIQTITGLFPFIYNYRTTTLTTNFGPLLTARGFFPDVAYFCALNESGEAVGEAMDAQTGKYDGFLYADGQIFRLRDLLPRTINYVESRAFVINSKGDIGGIWSTVDEFFNEQPFVLRRKRWTVGEPVAPPLQARNSGNNGKVFRTPLFTSQDGTPVDPQATVWSDLEQRFYFLRPLQGTLAWYTSSDPTATNAPVIARRGAAVWPDHPQIHVAGAPVSLDPVGPGFATRPVGIYKISTEATFDSSTRTFNNPGVGYTVIRYLIAPEVPTGGTPDQLTHTNYFEVVNTVEWKDPAYLVDNQPATVGTKVTDPRGPSVSTNSIKTGWAVFPTAPFDGVGADRAYDRTTQTGPIIPVNRDSAASDDDLVVAFYKKNTLTGALWPDLPVRFTIGWPTNAQKLVMANSIGSGPLPEDQYPDKRVYVQSSTGLPGFNPNEEHAFLAPTSSGDGVFALRNDLNRLATSEPFVLLKYRNPTNSEWQFKVFQPVLTDATHIFTYNGEAGKEILPPYPLGLFTICAGTTNISGKAFRDHQGKYYASTGPTPTDLNPQVIMRYSYPLQPTFAYDLDGNGTNDLPVGACVPWASIPPGGSLTKPVDVTYRIRWPDDAPTLEIGETVLNPKHGLPGVKDWASAQVVFDSLNPDGNTPLLTSARLYDPLSARVLRLTNVAGISSSYRFPPEITLQPAGGNEAFSDLPFHLRSRLSYDPGNQALSFAGFLDDTVVGEPLLLINVLSDKERLRIKQLSGEPDFRRIVDALYDLTRNPNGVSLAHPGQSPPDQALLIGFTTQYTVRVTNAAPPNLTTQNFFGARPAGNNFGFIATNVVQEPLGGAPKALTAGLPVPSANAAFGNALQLDGNAFVSTPQNIAAPQSFTLSAWFNTTNTQSATLIAFRDQSILPGFAGDRDLRLDASGAVSFYVYDIFGHSIGSPPGFNDGKWHHAAATFSSTTGMRLYVDGNLVSQNPNVTFAYTYPTGGYWRLGQGLKGALDEIQIWGVAQTAQQIKEGMSHPATGSESTLLRYWRLDEKLGTVALDSTANLADGDFQGNPQRILSGVPGGPLERYVVLAENNDPALGALPVTLHVIRVFGGPFVGDLKIIPPDNVFDQRLTLRHSSDFGADPDKLEFEWWYHPDNADFDPTALPATNPDGSIADPKGWLVYTPALTPNKLGQNTITIGDGGETSQFTLADNWFISRYRGYNIGGQTNWSDWVGDPSSDAAPRASLASGWIKRVLTGINPFEARTTDFHNNPASTFASMLIQAGHRYEGDIALNPSGENLLNIGLIETYTTVLNRGKSLSIDGVPPVDSDPLNNALLLAASRISDLYMLFGNEAFADAQDPTIGFFSDDLQFGTLATATFAFKNQLDSALAEELCLLRGRDDTAAGVGAQPVYNRLLWNFTGSDGEVAYERTYNIGDVNLDGVINEQDARILFPQGHGDAWGHYLTAVTTYYDLLRHPRFTWIPRTESVQVAGTAVKVDFLDERKFANAAAAKAKTGTEIVDLTYRSKYVDDPQGQYQGYKDTRADRAWGVTEWARRAGQGAYFDWVAGNAILPSADPNTNHTGIQKIDRQTVTELDQIISEHDQVQAHLDKSDAGLNPLGLAKGAVPFDIDPSLIVPSAGVPSVTHFDQIYDRAERAMNNCVTVWDLANQLSEALRRQQDDVDDFTANVTDQERDYKSRMIEVFGYPYSGDVGAGKTYPSGYDGPDLYHYMYVNSAELTGAANPPTNLNIITGAFTNFTDGSNAPNAYFHDDLSAANFSPGPILNVQFPLADGAWRFTAPANYGSRRAPGELQLALSDLLQEETRLKIALGNYDALVKNIKDAATLLQSRNALRDRVVTLLSNNKQSLQTLNSQIKSAQDEQIRLNRAASIIDDIANGITDSIPDSSDPLGLFGSVAKAVVHAVQVITSQALQGAADVKEIEENDAERSKEQTQLQTDLDVETASQDYEVKQQAAELLEMMRNESTLRLEAFNQAELVKQSFGRYQAALASGQRLLQDRTVFRQRTAANTQQNRYKDMAFRVFRNEALQKYRAQFDLTARYVYLAATAYDYELNFLGSDNRSARDFFTDIIRQRTIGQLIDGVPIAGSSGLADSLGRMRQNFEVLKPRFGLNNPQLETSRFSLRKELLRLRDGSGEQWRAVLKQAVVQNLWAVPEFRRYCRPFTPESAGAQPGLVIRFPTTINFGLNFFGFPLGGGDSAYDPSLFSTKIASVGVWFSDYNGAGLATAPRVYLVPVGMDIQRSPTGNTLATREWRVIDQVIPIPFPIGASDLTDPTWIPVNDSLADSFAQIRRFASFRAYHDAGDYDPAETTTDTRLIGRSVWNTDWMLIIPGGTFLADPNQGLDTFINSVGDIKLSLQSYSYPGD